MLDDFSSLKVEAKKPEASPALSGPGPAALAPPAEPSIDGLLSDDDFATQLQAGMADLLGEMESSVRTTTLIL